MELFCALRIKGKTKKLNKTHFILNDVFVIHELHLLIYNLLHEVKPNNETGDRQPHLKIIFHYYLKKEQVIDLRGNSVVFYKISQKLDNKNLNDTRLKHTHGDLIHDIKVPLQ